jgi:hypothetical protein
MKYPNLPILTLSFLELNVLLSTLLIAVRNLQTYSLKQTMFHTRTMQLATFLFCMFCSSWTILLGTLKIILSETSFM